MYKEKRRSTSEFIALRGLNYHVRCWQNTSAPSSMPALVLVHGWMDVAASYQFMVDALSDAFTAGRTIIAPDWRGFGLTNSVAKSDAESPVKSDTVSTADNFWLPDYLADLDFLLDHYAPNQPVDLVGHSMGGNIAMIYSGVRPERIRRLVNLEGFGLAPSTPAQAPGRYAKWMDQLKSLHKGELDLKAYDDISGVATRLMKTNSRLNQDKANWLASHWARQTPAGTWQILGEPGHKVVNANIYQVQETLEVYKRITAPVLAVEASEDSLDKWHQGRYTLADYHQRLKLVTNATVARVEDAGHMLHHDQPEKLAGMIEDFLG